MKQLYHLLTALIAIQNAQGHFIKRFNYIRGPLPLEVGEPLVLTPLIEAGKIQQARNESKVVYADFQNIEFYSGYFQVDKEYDNNLFFYFFPSENNFEEDPVILWLQGGPGSPSCFGLFMENGPFIIKTDYTVDLREYRWTRNHSVLYIDQPVGTGFSFTTKEGYAQNQTKVGQDLYQALIQFFTLFPEIQSNDFFITGESYAGKYIPALGFTILRNNPGAEMKIKLKGLAIGNGLSDPVHQADYGDYLFQLGLVDSNTRDQLLQYRSLVKQYTEEGQWKKATSYFDDIMTDLISEATGDINLYNYLEVGDNEALHWQEFLQEKVRDELHIGNTTFGSGPVFDLLYEDISKSVAPLVSELLNHYRVLIFNGQTDIIVGYPMTVEYLQNLNFSAAEEYKVASREIWRTADGVAGYYKRAGNLTEMLVRNAGHMVPIQQPKNAYLMIYSFTRGVPFIEDLDD